MNRRKSQIRPLLAARLKPLRRPPSYGALRSTTPALCISRDTESPDVQSLSSASDNCIAALEQVRQMTSALQIAQDGVERIQQHLQCMNDLVQSKNVHHDEIDREIQAIDQIANSTDPRGNRLLDGTWSVSVADPAGDGVRSLRIPSLRCTDLGHEGIGGFVVSIATDGGQTDILSRKLAIIRCAILQTASIHEELSAFLTNVANPLIDVLEIATANANAAQVTIQDTDMACQVSRLTKLDAMMHACPDSPKKHLQNFSDPEILRQSAGTKRLSDNNQLD